MVGQDLDQTDDGVFRIARRVAKDRVISTVDRTPGTAHKTASRGFDGYKGHVAVDPDSEIVADTVVTPGNVGDAAAAADLIDDLLDDAGDPPPDHAAPDDTPVAHDDSTDDGPATGDTASDDDGPTVYGDAAYGAGEFLDRLADAGVESRCKTQPPTAPGGMFTKDRFDIDLDDDTVTCPAGNTATIRRGADRGGTARFGGACGDCPLRAQCTTSAASRTIRVGFEQRLADARRDQQDPAWTADNRATRPKVERKLGHLMRRRHGGRRARVRGTPKVDADFNLLAAAHNLARLAVLGVRSTTTGWEAVTA